MSTQEAILVVIFAAIVVNLVIAVWLLVRDRLRLRRGEPAELDDAEISRRTMHRAHVLANGTAVNAGATAEKRAPLSIAPSAVDSAEDEPTAIGAYQVDTVPTDSVTGFDLPATWAKRLADENARIQRYGRAATIVLVELGGLDRLAERLGADAAERLIPPIATTMRRHARSSDSLARLGHTRFAALLPDTDEVKAINYIERVRASCDVWLEAGAVSLRLSIGWAEINPTQPGDVAAHAADRRLFEERQRLRVREDRDVEDEDGRELVAQMRPAQAN